jgi:hypothetical protein
MVFANIRVIGAKKTPCNFEESPFVTRIFFLNVIYENVDIVLIEINRFHQVF